MFAPEGIAIMGTLGSASIKLNLDRSQFDSDLKKLQATDAGQIAYRIKLDTKDFERQIKGLRIQQPILIPLEIDTKTFDQQIKKLSTSIDPIKIDLAPNVKDFQEKLRRLSNISPVTVDIKVDESKIRQQFETIGKYAAEGFTQGFSGVEGAGKSAIDSMVKSVNKQLGIQSPSKVFRDIGKYAIAGLMQGLDSVDESKLKGVTNKIEGYFKKSKIKINVDIDVSGISGKVKVQAPASEKTGDFAKNITKSIEDGFQKAKPKANFLGAIFGGLGSLITIPLAGVLRGAFEGIGTPLGLQLGSGVSKAIQSTLGQNIGSLELISQKAVEKSLQAIPAAQSAIVEVIKNNPIGGAVVKQLESLQKTLELYSINLSPQKAVKSLATDEERAVASSSANFESQQSQFKSRKKAKASASLEFLSTIEQKDNIQTISSQLAEKEKPVFQKDKEVQKLKAQIDKFKKVKDEIGSVKPDTEEGRVKQQEILEKTNSKLVELLSQLQAALKNKPLAEKVVKAQSLQLKIAKTEKTNEKIDASDLDENRKTALKLVGQKRIIQLSKELLKVNEEIAQDSQEIEKLRAAKKAYEDKLSSQVKLLASLGVGGNFSAKAAELLELSATLEQSIVAQKAVKESRKNIKINAKTPESIREKKLDKLQANADFARKNLQDELANPEANVENVKKLEKKALLSGKALELYKIEISNPEQAIEQTTNHLNALNKKLASALEGLQIQLSSGLNQAIESASREVVNVGNLDLVKIPEPAKPTRGQLALDRQALASEQEAKKVSQLQQLKQLKAQQVNNLPKLYVDAVQSVSRIITGQNLEREKIPNIVPSTEIAGRGDYNAKANTYRIRPDLYQQLQTGDIDKVAKEAIGNIVHEIFHAFQHNFGKAIADNTGQLAVDITPTPEELSKVGDKVESSVAIQPDERKPLSRQLETGANVFQLRNTDRVREELKRNQLKGQALSLGGVGGSKIALTDVNKLYDVIASYIGDLRKAGIDVTKQREKYIKLLGDIREQASAIGAKSVDLDNLPTIDIEAIVKQYQEILQTVENTKAEVAQQTQQLPQTQALKEELVIQNSKPQLARVAKELGVKGVSGKDKQGLADAIVGTGTTPEVIRSKLPAPTVATEKILASAQKLLQLPSQELEKSTKYAVNSFGLKLKAIAKNLDDRDKLQELQKVLSEIDELEKTYIAAKVKTLDESLQNVFQGRILGLQKQRVAATYQLKPLVGKNLDTQTNTDRVTQPTDAEISTSRKNLDELSAKSAGGSIPPVNFVRKLIAPPPPGFYSPIAKSKTTLPPPPPGFNLPIGKSDAPLSVFPIPPTPEQVDPRFGVKAIVPFERKTPSTVGQVKPNYEVKALVPYESKLPALLQQTGSGSNGGKSAFPVPPPPPDFNLPIKIKQLVDKVKDSGELFKIVVDIQKDQTKNILQKLKKYDQILKIYDDLEAEKAKQNQALDDKFDPEKVDRQRETITQRAKLSAKLERKYGMEGLAPEILPDRINSLGEVQKSPSIFQGIKDIFKSLDNSVAKRVKKRAAQLAIEVDTAIAPSLEAGAIDAQQRGDKVEQKQYQKLAKQSRAATKGIAKILESPGDLTEKQVKQLDRLTSQLEKVYDAIGRPLPSQGFLESIGVGAGGAIGLVKNLGGVLKGFLAFQIGMWAQNFFGSIAQESFKAFVELDRLKTALNFASGGTAGGAQNLAFVRKTVEDLGIPLKASTEGFTQLASASRGSALEGKETREIFKGMAEASTVLGLSAEDTQGAMLALEQMISKGKIGADDYRIQLGTRLPGAMGLLARAAGVTETELNRLMESGQAITQDLFPKLSRQFHAEYGEEAKTAGHNAQSSIFKVQNSFLSLQQGIGEGVSPAAIAGLDALSDVLKQVAKVGKEIAIIISAVSTALLLNLGKALWTIIGQLILTKAAGATLGGAFSQLASTINNSFSAQITVGIFALLEAINLVNSAVNTELVKSFQKAAESAKRAAEESRKAFGDPGKKPEKDDKKSGESSTKPVASSWFGQFMDDHIMPVLNADIGPFRGGDVFSGSKETFGSKEQAEMQGGTGRLIADNANLVIDTRKAIKQLQSRTGDIGKLPTVDANLQKAEQQRQILQAQIKRDYVDKGVAIPASAKTKLDGQNIKIQQLNDERAEIAKPYTLQITRLDRQINDTKSAREALKTEEGIKVAGGTEAAARMDDQLKQSGELLKGTKARAESALAALRVDPIRAFTQALRGLNLALAEGQEKNKENLSQRKLANAREAIAGFSTDKLASKKLTFKNANDEYIAAQIDEANSATAVKTYDEAASKPDFQSTLKRLGLTPDSSAAKIDDILKNTSDESDKNILEQLKAGRESKVKFTEAQSATVDTKAKRDQVIQDTSLYLLDDSAANSRAAIQKDENDKISFLKGAQAAKLISEEMANEQIAKIQLNSSQSQKKNIVDQLTTLRAYHEQGKVSAEEFTKRQRDLSTELTTTERQEAENRLAVQQSVLAHRLKEIEFFNKKAEALTATRTTDRTRENKEKLLSAGLTPQSQDQFALDQTKVDATTASDRVNSIKARIAQNKQLYKDGLRDARDFTMEQYALNQELASANLAVVDQKISAEEKYRETVEHNIQRIMQAEENRFKKQTSQLDESKSKLDLYNQSLERTNRLEQSRRNLSKALSDAAIAPLENKKADGDDALALVEKLKDPKLKPQVKAAIVSQLEKLGYKHEFGLTITPATVTKASSGDTPEDYELRIKEKQAQIEKEIENRKQKALEMEQEFQRKTLENDLKRQKIAAQIALYEAQSAQLSAQKAKNEAEGALKIAISKKDLVAIETAQTNLDIANKQVNLSNERVDSAQANLNDQSEIAANSTAEQKATQGAQTESLAYGEKRRQRQSALDLVEAGEKARRPISLSSAEAKVESTNPQLALSVAERLALPQRIDINQMPKLELKPGESLFDAYQRQREGMKLPTSGAQLPSSKVDIPPVDKTALAVNSTSIQPRESGSGNQFVEALKMANQGIEQRLDALNSAIMMLANTPRSLTVQSPNPVDDAAKLMNDFSRGQVMAAGV